ncbi:MAG TPA: cyclopropane-fatty-acyl-phospholipid synthase family protein [Candidatus Acidoferrum sp.]|nr:cyclopropane-fatty-acyl-phospholipid synthase family protein [Candidatus Acidoferrum sp.]
MNPWFASQAKKLFFHSLRDLRCGFLEIVCPEETYTFGDPAATLRAMAVVHDQRFFVRALSGADIGIGESYMDGDWTSPELVSLVRLCVRNVRLLDTRNKLFSGIRAIAARLQHRLRANTIAGSRKNIRAHYDLGNVFYELMLDDSMLYSCAQFLNGGDSLETAQLRKLDLICAKLRIEPGDTILEIGCGWGAFAIHAARNFGARVTAVTISQAQYDYAAALLARTDVRPGHVKLLLEDYRRLEGQFDKIVSIEMFEAVGFAHYDEYFSACDRLLKLDGSMLMQTITLPEQEVAAYRRRTDWIQTYIFPGSELASVTEISRSLARATQLAMTHVETMGLHYAQTLAAWRQRFFQNLEAVRHLGFDERFIRMWDFYLAWCDGAFRERYINLAQVLLAKHGTQRPLLGDPTTAMPALITRISRH